MKSTIRDTAQLYYANPIGRAILKDNIRQVFDLFDADGSGGIDSKEFHELLYSTGELLTDEQVEQCLAVLDKDHNGSISFEEFFVWWM
jgi:Ca2+-binding EF-hand superfamily protein